MVNFQHILVPVDFSEANQSALRTAQRLAVQNDARVTLLHVIETIDYIADDEVEAFYKMLTARSGERLRELAQPFRDEQLPVDEQIVVSKRARGIVNFAVENEVDLIVMNSHRIDAEDPHSGFGTISHQVSVFCPCAVLLVR